MKECSYPDCDCVEKAEENNGGNPVKNFPCLKAKITGQLKSASQFPSQSKSKEEILADHVDAHCFLKGNCVDAVYDAMEAYHSQFSLLEKTETIVTDNTVSQFSSQGLPTKDLKYMAVKFMEWYVDNPNDEVYKEQMAMGKTDNLISDLYDVWLQKYFTPETISAPSQGLREEALEFGDYLLKQCDSKTNEYDEILWVSDLFNGSKTTPEVYKIWRELPKPPNSLTPDGSQGKAGSYYGGQISEDEIIGDKINYENSGSQGLREEDFQKFLFWLGLQKEYEWENNDKAWYMVSSPYKFGKFGKTMYEMFE